MLVIAVGGRTDLLQLGWLDAAATSVVLAYLQRAAAWLVAGERRAGAWAFLLEPVVNLVGLLDFTSALFLLARPARRVW